MPAAGGSERAPLRPKLVGEKLVRASDEEQAVQSKTPHLAMHVIFLVKVFKSYFNVKHVKTILQPLKPREAHMTIT